MSRFYVPQPQIESGLLRVEGSEVKHIRKVLRLKAGDRITIFDGSAREYEGSIVESEPSFVSIRVLTTSSPQRDSPLGITLAQSLLKGEKMDYLIQKATELGMERIVPFVSARSVPLVEESKQQERRRRWEKIAIEASKQCGRGSLPKIEPLQEYAEMLRSASPDSIRLILCEREGVSLKETLKGSAKRKRVFFIVGPEGGLSQEEVEAAREEGFVPVTLGKRILRSETASLCLLSILQYEWGDIG
jgi:16S rRNA (uracil1498-N3)-methyltransferase